MYTVAFEIERKELKQELAAAEAISAKLREAAEAADAALSTCRDHCEDGGLGPVVAQSYDSAKIADAHLKLRSALALALTSAGSLSSDRDELKRQLADAELANKNLQTALNFAEADGRLLEGLLREVVGNPAIRGAFVSSYRGRDSSELLRRILLALPAYPYRAPQGVREGGDEQSEAPCDLCQGKGYLDQHGWRSGKGRAPMREVMLRRVCTCAAAKEKGGAE